MNIGAPDMNQKPVHGRLDEWARHAFQVNGKSYFAHSDCTIWGISRGGSITYKDNIPCDIQQAVKLWFKSPFVFTMPVYRFMQQVLGE